MGRLDGGESCCAPGDITVAKIYTGFLIGRAVERKGPGPWWEYVSTVRSFRQATLRAHKLAKAAPVRAWFHLGGEAYELLPKWTRRPRRGKTSDRKPRP
jgi:hypothetical protein